MRILLISPRFYPEPFTITRIAVELARRGNDITVLTGRPHYGKWAIYPGYERVRSENHCGVKIIRVKEVVRKKGAFSLALNYFSISTRFRRAIKKIDGEFDIVFSHVLSPIFVMNGISSFCKKRGIPHFHYGFDLWPESLVATGYFRRSNILFRLVKRISAKLYRGCDQIAFASPSVKTYFDDYLKISVPFVHIYQPCLTTALPSSVVGDHVYKKDGKLHILFCGTIARFNHLDLLISALESGDISQKVIVDIVGSGSDKDRIEGLVKEKKLGGTVVFHGRVAPEDTKEFYQMADILFVPLFCNSATSLMIPQKLIECLMYSRPIFGMIKGDGAKLLNDSSKLNVVSDQTVSDLSASIDALCHLPVEDLKKCGEDNRRFFDENKRFSLPVICDEIEHCLIALAEKGKPSSKGSNV